ncbi:MAG: sensor histidine kinase [Acidobacteriota bacterium]|nr:sensor histidine kinase [Acidobacteriota bacterium]
MSSAISSLKRPPLRLRPGANLRQTRVALLAGFGGLLLLLTIFGASAISSMYQIEVREAAIRNEYLDRTRSMESLRSNIYLSGTQIREYLLDPTDLFADTRRRQFRQTKRAILSEAGNFGKQVPAVSRETFLRLQKELDAYFGAVEPSLDWKLPERHLEGYPFTQTVVLPRRTEVLEMADQVQRSIEVDLERSSEAVGQMLSAFRIRLIALLVLTLLTGIAAAGLSLRRILRLETEAQNRFVEVLTAREELQRLSAELLSAQETERRRISRELHDEVGQVLSAISYTLANVRSAFRTGNADEGFECLDRVQGMTEQNLAVVRNIALLLRPTMLDDLGLVPAVRWLTREVARTAEIDTDVVASGFLDDLPEDHKTCVFRVVQEALRNAARHSGARHIRIYLKQEKGELTASVQDDGRGFDPDQDKGMGIIGMEERALNLGGKLTLTSKVSEGTIVTLELPYTSGRHESGLPSMADFQAQISPLRTA